VPGSGGDDEVAHLVERIHRLAVHFRVGEDGGEVVRGVFLALLDDFREVLSQLQQSAHLRLALVGIALEVRVQRAEDFLGQFQHGGFGLARQAEDRHDDAQRVEQGDVLDEVTLATRVAHAVDILAAQGLHLVVQLGDGAGQEPLPGHAAQFEVLGLVHVDECLQPVFGTELGLQCLLRLDGQQDRARGVEEAVVLAADALDVFIFGQ